MHLKTEQSQIMWFNMFLYFCFDIECMHHEGVLLLTNLTIFCFAKTFDGIFRNARLIVLALFSDQFPRWKRMLWRSSLLGCCCLCQDSFWHSREGGFPFWPAWHWRWIPWPKIGQTAIWGGKYLFIYSFIGIKLAKQYNEMKRKK